MSSKLYSEFFSKLDTDMITEVHEAISAIGGEISEIRSDINRIIISIDDELKEEAQNLVDSILEKYNNKRKKALKNPFLGVLLIKGGIDAVE